MLKADLHIHTKYSMDSGTALEDIISRCQKLEINCIAIADHGTVTGALKMKSMAPFYVIVAEEVLTPHGEIMGMFLKETIPSGLSVAETIAKIREQDGLVCIPHLFDTIRGSTLDNKTVEEIVEHIDAVEAFNSRSLLLNISSKAEAFADKHHIAKSAGSDAHTINEIGHAYIEIPEFTGKDDFLKSLVQGKISGHRTNPFIHVNSTLNRLKSQIISP
ncbi:MAG: PHP domain-containing protein, partial [Dehalococcoidales bacterium]|nr:PHP domain-containing protein [Dehalococcoidales bacterium]